MMDAPPNKKLKVEDRDQIFLDFRRNKEILGYLNDACLAIRNGSNMQVRVLEILETNARAIESFTRATCSTKPYRTKSGLTVSFPFGSLFADGLKVLQRFIEDSKVPKDKASRNALRKLVQFMSTSFTCLKQPEKDVQECKWAVQLAQHLFSELAVGNQFTLDNLNTKKKEMEKKCPCEMGDNLKGKFGDTSFGCPKAWHGSVDILFENVAIQVIEEEDTNEDDSALITSGRFPSHSNDSSVEVKSGETFDYSGQMLAQCIVFSFLQRSLHTSRMDHFLVPSFGVHTTAMVISFYDSKNDVLLQSNDLDLFVAENFLAPKMLVCLWLAMNHRCFCTGITEVMKGYKAKFHQFVGDYLKMYEENVCMPVVKVPNQISEPRWECGPAIVTENPSRIEEEEFDLLEDNSDK